MDRRIIFRADAEFVKKLDFLVENRPRLLQRDRTGLIRGVINAEYEKLIDYLKKQKDEQDNQPAV